MLACGMDPNGVMAELTGRRDGYSKGKGGSMHMFSTEKHFYGGHGIVGAQVSLGTGLAFANRYRGNDNVSLPISATARPTRARSTKASTWPSCGSCRSSTSSRTIAMRWALRSVAPRRSTDFSKRGLSFDIPGEQVDGMDVRAVKAAGEKAVEWCRDGNGPYILEMQTYRYRGHSMSDPAKYRTREEVEKVRHDQDPIEQVRQRLLALNVARG